MTHIYLPINYSPAVVLALFTLWDDIVVVARSLSSESVDNNWWKKCLG
jgi:hypothetical protein